MGLAVTATPNAAFTQIPPTLPGMGTHARLAAQSFVTWQASPFSEARVDDVVLLSLLPQPETTTMAPSTPTLGK